MKIFPEPCPAPPRAEKISLLNQQAAGSASPAPCFSCAARLCGCISPENHSQ